MSTQPEFDAYHKWLGIPPHQQPPTLYRLLGLEPFESDADVIHSAVERQMAHLQSYKIGPQSDLSQKLLNEIARAKVCLLNSASKADYDRQLRARLDSESAGADIQQTSVSHDRSPPEKVPESPEPSNVDDGLGDKLPLPTRGNHIAKRPPARTLRPNIRRRRKSLPRPLIAAAAAGTLAVVVGLAAIAYRSTAESNESAQNDTALASVAEQVSPIQPPTSQSDSPPIRESTELDQPKASEPKPEKSPMAKAPELVPPSMPADEPGFVLLFDSSTLNGWTGDTSLYSVEDGSLVNTQPGHGVIYTKDEFSDFILRFDYRLTSGADNGIALRTPLNGNPAFEGMEIQLLDESASQFRGVPKWQKNGSLCGLAAAEQGAQNSVGTWNSEEIVAKGRNVAVTLNGTSVLEANLDQLVAGQATGHSGLHRTSGHIALMADMPRVEFRNIRIRILPSQPEAVLAPAAGEFPDLLLPSGRKITQQLLYLPPEKIKRPFAERAEGFFVLTDSSQRKPVGLFGFQKTGLFHGAAMVVGDNGQPSILLSYSSDKRDHVLRTWDADGTLVLWSEYRNGRKFGLTCLCGEGRPVRIEDWGAGQAPTEYIVEYSGSAAVVTAKKDATVDQRKKLADTGKALDNIEKLVQSHERQWKVTFKKWWHEIEKPLKSSPSEVGRQLASESRAGVASVLKGF